eukprot:TRINITY_DN5611_c0_g1_i1.p1 TRINITY_DN5611_c0_g1~~TRINITY_DN5611_c0_g1_i1.p1  ORF type:complete len:604 (+),score=196.10 TRINITY_DN5611_c0_g1_i1:134-1813(+)
MRRAAALFAVAAGCSAHTEHVEHVQGGQHQDEDYHGFEVKSIFFHQPDDDKAPIRRHVLKPTQRRATTKAFESWNNGQSTTRELVVGLAKLNMIAYPGDLPHRTVTGVGGYPASVSDPLLAQDNILGANNRSTVIAAGVALWNTIWAEASAAGVLRPRYDPDVGPTGLAGGAYDVTGLAALEFIRGTQHVLVFRGSYNPGDYINIRNWILPWGYEKMDDHMKQSWTEFGGYEWTAEMQARRVPVDQYYCLIENNPMFRSTETSWDSWGLRVSNLTGTMTQRQAVKTGYWTLVKAMVDSVLTSMVSGSSLILTGHSQGGAHAQMASMWLRTRGLANSRRTPAVTFASAGGGVCTPRYLHLGHTNLLTEINPYIFHDQIVDYAHALDPWGNNLGIDAGTTRFYNQRGDLNDLGYKWCKLVYGETALKMVYTNDARWNRCLIATHQIEVILTRLQENSRWTDEARGLVVGGEYSRRDTGIAATSAVCPEGRKITDCDDDDSDYWIIGVVIACVAAVVLVVVLVVWCKKPPPAQKEDAEREFEPVGAAAEEGKDAADAPPVEA